MLKTIVANVIDEIFALGMEIISEAEYNYDFTCVGGDILPEYWDECEWGNKLIRLAINMGWDMGYDASQTVWVDEVEYIR